MMRGILIAACLVAVFLGQSKAQDYDDWFQTVKVQNTEDLTFNCSNWPTHPSPEYGENTENMTIHSWMLPTLEIIDDNFDNGKYEVLDGGWSLRIHNVNTSDFGIYHCMLKRPSGEWYLVKWGVNIKGPYFEDLWEKYEMNVIIGLSAAGGFLVLAFMVWIVWHFRWQEPEEENLPYQSSGKAINAYEMVSPNRNKGSEGYTNQAFEEGKSQTPPPDYDSDLRQRKLEDGSATVDVHKADVTYVAEAQNSVSDTRM